MGRSTARRVCLLVAGLAVLAAGAIGAAGGYEFTIAGRVIRGHRIDRLLILSGLALAGFFLAGGRAPLPSRDQVKRVFDTVARGGRRVARAAEGAARASCRPSVCLVVVLAALLANAWLFGARAAGGSDSYGYVSQAHLWAEGRPVRPVPWVWDAPWHNGPRTLEPLGYTTIETRLDPSYPVGLPLIMAAFIRLGGACAAFAVVPLMGMAAVVLLALLGHRLGGAWTGVAAAWLLATSPTFLYMFAQPMSDVPVTALWLAAWVVALGRGPTAPVISGLLSSAAVLVRPNLAPVVVSLMMWFLVRPTAAGTRATRWTGLGGYLLGLGPAVVTLAAVNTVFYGSAFRTGYGSLDAYFAAANIGPNAIRYASWLTLAETPVAWLGLAAIVVPLSRVWIAGPRVFVAATGGFAVLLVVLYLPYLVFDAWWYLRFLLPALPFVFLGVARLATGLAARSTGMAVLAAGVVAAVGAHGLWFASRHAAFDARVNHGGIAAVARAVRGATEADSVVFSHQHSGSLRALAGRMTIRYDAMPADSLDGAVEWLAAHGYHPYALLEWWEVEQWRSAFGGRARSGVLPERPIRTMAGGTVLYDLLASGPAEPRVVPVTASDLECRSPMSEPAPLPFTDGERRP